MIHEKECNVIAIIVTFDPETEVLIALLKAIEPQVTDVIVVDNGSQNNIIVRIQQVIPQNGVLIEKGYNSGVATAINTGIAEASKLGASHVVLFDQDSIPAPNMVYSLLTAINERDDVAAVGPCYSDIKGQNTSPFVRLEGFTLKRITCKDGEVANVSHLISSGCLISMDVLKTIGDMQDSLFIDYVDIEWCLRAVHKGYSLLGVGSAHMQHDLGDDFACVFGRTLPVHSPLRQYYFIRNGVWVLRQSWVSNRWRIMDLRRLLSKYIIYSFFAGERFKNFKMMSLGIWHGLVGKEGPRENISKGTS